MADTPTVEVRFPPSHKQLIVVVNQRIHADEPEMPPTRTWQFVGDSEPTMFLYRRHELQAAVVTQRDIYTIYYERVRYEESQFLTEGDERLAITQTFPNAAPLKKPMEFRCIHPNNTLYIYLSEQVVSHPETTMSVRELQYRRATVAERNDMVAAGAYLN